MFFYKKLVVCFDSVPALHIQTQLFLDQYIHRLYPPTIPKVKINKPHRLANLMKSKSRKVS